MTNKPNKPTTQLPFVDPRVTDPRALAYQRDLEQRGRQQLPKYNEPTAGGPTPPIPMLDSQHVEGQTMAQQGAAQRRPPAGQGSIFEPPPSAEPSGPMPPPPPRVAPSSGPLNIVPSDLLPEEAQNDPAFQRGHGSMYAVAQPELARKYGVIRGDQRIPPQMLVRQQQQGAPQKLSPETIEGLKTFRQLQEQGEQVAIEQGDKEAEEAAKASVAGEAATAGSGLKTAKSEVDTMMSSLDLEGFRERLERNVIQNDEQKKIIEARLKPLDLSELITQGTITQIVPVQPGIFEPEFQSVSAEDDLAMKRLIIEEANSLKVDDRYLLDKFALMGITCAIRAINRLPLPDHRDEKGNFNDEKFWKKFAKVLRFPLPMISSLGANYFWFDIRVRKLFVAERVKNG